MVVDVHLMSGCAFGRDAMKELLPVLDELGPRVALRLNFVGRAQDGQLTSMYGPGSVALDTRAVCAADHASASTFRTFLTCELERPLRDERSSRVCAERAGIDPVTFESCVSGDRGRSLLSASYAASAANGIQESPVLHVNGVRYEGGRSRHHFADMLCAALTDPPPYCRERPDPPEVVVTIVNDARCQGESCDVAKFVRYVESTFAGAHVEQLDVASPRGTQLFNASGVDHLPIAFFGPEVVADSYGYRRIAPVLKPVTSEGYVLALAERHRPAVHN